MTLLRLGLLFPGTAPRRLTVALRAGSTRALRVAAKDDTEAGRAAVQLLGMLTRVARHDAATRRHSERVRAYTDLLAAELRLPSADRDRLRWAALVHDLGRSASTRACCASPAGSTPPSGSWSGATRPRAPGSPRRWRTSWAPGSVGSASTTSAGTAPATRPGWWGSRSRRAARIIAVADALEVMTASRPYSRPVHPDAARAELVRCSGGQFDPQVVRALLGLPLRRLAAGGRAAVRPRRGPRVWPRPRPRRRRSPSGAGLHRARRHRTVSTTPWWPRCTRTRCCTRRRAASRPGTPRRTGSPTTARPARGDDRGALARPASVHRRRPASAGAGAAPHRRDRGAGRDRERDAPRAVRQQHGLGRQAGPRSAAWPRARTPGLPRAAGRSGGTPAARPRGCPAAAPARPAAVEASAALAAADHHRAHQGVPERTAVGGRPRPADDRRGAVAAEADADRHDRALRAR